MKMKPLARVLSRDNTPPKGGESVNLAGKSDFLKFLPPKQPIPEPDNVPGEVQVCGFKIRHFEAASPF
jgi:hypothetical protein